MTPNPPRPLVVEFTKMSGAGNDFIVLDNRFYFFGVEELSQMAIRFCARRTGIGADGILALEASESADFRMRYLNADGSVGTMCGNGARCLARYAANAGIEAGGDGAGVDAGTAGGGGAGGDSGAVAKAPSASDGAQLCFETDAGIYTADMLTGGVRLYIPDYQDFATLAADHDGPERCYLWTGTEHLVVFVDSVAETDVATLGARLRRTNPPAGANVNFAEVDGQRLRLRTFEKGVEAETLACGTGATAAAAAARLTGRLAGETVDVHMPGGVLTIGFHADGRARYLEGPAETVFRGTLEVPV